MTRLEDAWRQWDYQTGRRIGWVQGYRAGFTAGTEVGGAGTLIALKHALPEGVLLDLLPDLPYIREYERLQRLREVNHDPCRLRCGNCSQCVHSMDYWRRGGRDYLGVEAERQLTRADKSRPRRGAA